MRILALTGWQPAPGQPVVVPQSALHLVGEVTKYCGAGQPAGPAMAQQSPLVQQHAVGESEMVRNQLARLAPELYELLDARWATYLALPPEVFTGRGHPTKDALLRCLERFDAVARDASYRALAEHPEFQSTHGLLRHYVSAQSPDTTKLLRIVGSRKSATAGISAANNIA